VRRYLGIEDPFEEWEGEESGAPRIPSWLESTGGL
jgi:hypothetical protein